MKNRLRRGFGLALALYVCVVGARAEVVADGAGRFAGPPLVWQLNDAAARGDVAALREVLARGARVDATLDSAGMTALMVAVDARSADVLLAAGAEVDRADARGWTPLHHAATRAGGDALAARLLAAGADAHRRNARGETPLRLAGLLFTENIDRVGGEALIARLVAHGADIDARDDEGRTLLHQAADNDHGGLAAVCLRLGADADARVPSLETPRELALRLGSRAFLKVLARFGGMRGEMKRGG